MTTAYELVRDRVTTLTGSGREYGGRLMARCPVHSDRSPSLSIRPVPGRVLVTCFGACRTEDVVAALGLTMKDLFDPSEERWHRPCLPARAVEPADPSWSYVAEVPAATDAYKFAIYAAATAHQDDPRKALAETARRNREHDREVIERGLALPPAYRNYRELHHSVSASVWRRCWSDLSPGTRKRFADLDPEATA